MSDMDYAGTTIKPEQIIEIIIRFRWLIVIPICISLTIGLIFSVVTKKTYQASTTILIQPQKVPTEYVQSIVSSDIAHRLDIISQQILSRSNLEKIIDQFGLYENSGDMYLEDKIYSMRRRISVKIENTKKEGIDNANVFSLSFKGSDPERVMRVANGLASYFMDENLKVREAQAVGTSEFLQSELEKLEKVLEEKEKTLSEYRTRNLGGLPDELEANLRTLDRLQVQLSDKQAAVIDLKNSLGMLETQISRIKQEKDDLENEEAVVDEILNAQMSELEQLYEAQKLKLDELRSKYTDKHPDIIKLKKNIELTEEKLKNPENTDEKESAEKQINNALAVKSRLQKENKIKQLENYIFEQQLQANKIRADIKKHEIDIKSIMSSMETYGRKVQETPKREQELQSLQRDYQNIRENYNSLLARKLESEIAVNMEKKQKGEQFRILDYARIPEKPISPNIQKLFLMSLMIGLGIGGGITFLLEFLNKTIKSPEEIETHFDLPILATIPHIKVSSNSMRSKLEILFFSFVTLYLVVAFTCFAIIYTKGIDKTIGLLKAQLNF